MTQQETTAADWKLEAELERKAKPKKK